MEWLLPQAEAWGIERGDTFLMAESDKVCYHVWFATKTRKWLLWGEVEEQVKETLWQTARDRRIELLACETMVDHVHLLLRSNPNNLPRAIFLLKGVSARRVFQAFPELKLDAEIQSFWQARYGSKTISEDAVPSLEKYIASQKNKSEKYDRFPG